jgi:hypothetical protein
MLLPSEDSISTFAPEAPVVAVRAFVEDLRVFFMPSGFVPGGRLDFCACAGVGYAVATAAAAVEGAA